MTRTFGLSGSMHLVPDSSCMQTGSGTDGDLELVIPGLVQRSVQY